MNTIASEKGYSILEVLISAALGVIVLAGAFDVYISSTKSIMGQANIVQMQADTKAAMDNMVAELRMAYTGSTTLAAAIVASNTITFYRTVESGYATSGTTTTLTSTGKSWATNKFASTSAGTYFLFIKTGGGSGQVSPATIQSNTSNTLTVTPALATAPGTDSLFFIVRQKTFTLLGDMTVRSLITGGNKYHLLAKNVTELSFSVNPLSPPNMGCSATSVCITLSARSKDLDPRTKQYRTYSLTSIAMPRN